MRRLPLVDAALLAILVPIWLIALALHVRQVTTGRLAHVGVYVSAPAARDGYPSVRMFWPTEGMTHGGLQLGDRLVSVGETDLGGAGPLEFFAIAHEELARGRALQTEPRVRVAFRRGDERGETELPFVPAPFPWRMLPLTLGFVVTGTLVLIRRPGVPVARAFFVAAIVFSIHWTWFFGGDRIVTYVWAAVYLLASAAMYPLMLRAASMFPEEAEPRSRATLWAWLFAINGPIALTGSIGTPLPPAFGLRGVYLMNLAFIAALLGVLTRNYRNAGPLGRRQMKWGVYGIYAGLAPVFAANAVTLMVPEWWWLLDVAVVGEVLIPVCIFIAIVRFNLYDIDRLITATVAYSILSVVLLGAVLIVVPPLAEAASALMGIERRMGTSAFSVILAVSLMSFYRSLSPRIERLLFRERYALQQGINGLLSDLSVCRTPAELWILVGKRLMDLFRPATCVIYHSGGAGYVSVFAGGSMAGGGAPPTLSAQSDIIRTVEGSKGPLDVEEWRGGRGAGGHAHEQVAIKHLAPAVMVPVMIDEGLAAIISLGAKRSGDIYSPGDLAFLAALADKLAGELVHFDEVRRTASGPVLIPRKYEVISEIGRGGMGRVYKVRHLTLETVLALKILPDTLVGDAELVVRFHREARVMAQLNHPHIVRVFDVDQEGQLHYFVMEYVEGRSLNAILRERGPRPLAEILEVTRQIGSALAYAHAHEPAVIHRDIKPSNILVEEGTGRAVLTDFGIAKIGGLEQTLRTRTGDVFGTFKYCAPEQLRGDRDVDARADVYGLGMVIYEMFSGRGFFDGLEDHEIMGKVLYDPRENVPDLGRGAPRELCAMVARAITKDRIRRYQSVSDLLADVERLRDALRASDTTEKPSRAADSMRATEPPSEASGDATRAVVTGARRSPSRRSP